MPPPHGPPALPRLHAARRRHTVDRVSCALAAAAAAAALACSAEPAAAVPPLVLVTLADDPSQFVLDPYEAPAVGNISASAGAGPLGRAFTRLAYDFTGGGWTLTASLLGAADLLDFATADALVLALANEHTSGYVGAVVRVTDATGQAHTAYPSLAPGWRANVTLPLDNSTFVNHEGGANDGAFHFPLTGLSVGANKPPAQAPQTGVLDIGVVAIATNATVAQPVTAAFLQPGELTATSGVVYAGEMAGGALITLNVTNRMQSACAANASLAVHVATGTTGIGAGGDVAVVCASINSSEPIPSWGTVSAVCVVDASQPGYMVVRATVSGATCASSQAALASDAYPVAADAAIAMIDGIPSLYRGRGHRASHLRSSSWLSNTMTESSSVGVAAVAATRVIAVTAAARCRSPKHAST